MSKGRKPGAPPEQTGTDPIGTTEQRSETQVVRVTLNMPIAMKERLDDAVRVRPAGYSKFGFRNRTAAAVILDILDDHLPT